MRAALALQTINGDSGVTVRQERARNRQPGGDLPLGLAPPPDDREDEDEEQEEMETENLEGAGDSDDEDDDEDALQKGQGTATSPPAEVDTMSQGETASTMTGQFYSESFARRLLKPSGAMYESQIQRFVVHEVFRDMKFTQGDDEEEMGLTQLAIDEKYVVLDDARIPNSAFVAEFYPSISKYVTLLRTRSQNNARKKFQSKCGPRCFYPQT